MKIQLNGQLKEIHEKTNISQLLHHLEINEKVVIVEVNEQIVKRDLWAETLLANGDVVELIRFVGGG